MSQSKSNGREAPENEIRRKSIPFHPALWTILQWYVSLEDDGWTDEFSEDGSVPVGGSAMYKMLPETFSTGINLREVPAPSTLVEAVDSACSAMELYSNVLHFY